MTKHLQHCALWVTVIKMHCAVIVTECYTCPAGKGEGSVQNPLLHKLLELVLPAAVTGILVVAAVAKARSGAPVTVQ